MADLDEVAGEMRARHGRRLRVATKYANLTRRFFAETGVADYRIVESLGATEGAPASGAADLIVDITTTGATLAANGLKVLDDGIMLRSEANLIASLKAPWGARARATVRTVLSRIAAEEEARTTREIRAGMDPGRSEVETLTARYGAVLPFGRESGCELVLHCPAGQVFQLVETLIGLGAQDVTVRAVDYVFRRTNPLAERLFGRLGPDLLEQA
jgi:ATP phosphoribosyltransferase